MIKAVIFDIDNTLYDFDRANRYGMEAVQDYCARSFGLEEPHFQKCYRKAWHMAEQRVGGHGHNPQPDAPFSVHDGIIGSAPVAPCQNTGLYILGYSAGTDGAISRRRGAVSNVA